MSADRFLSVELRRGYNAAVYATPDSGNFNNWVTNFARALALLERNHTDSVAFLLGAHFGFSYRVTQFECQNHMSILEEIRRRLAIRSNLALLDCRKRSETFKLPTQI
jgi:hypothetical protein